MILKPVLTEKSLSLAKEGYYTFWVAGNLTKAQIKRIIGDAFGVHVTVVKTLNYKGSVRKNFRGQKRAVKAFKKAIVGLKEKESIELFEKKEKK